MFIKWINKIKKCKECVQELESVNNKRKRSIIEERKHHEKCKDCERLRTPMLICEKCGYQTDGLYDMEKHICK